MVFIIKKVNQLSLIVLVLFSAFTSYANIQQSEVCLISEVEQKLITNLGFEIDSESFLKYSTDCSDTLLTKFLLSLKKLKAVEFDEIPEGIDNEVTRALQKPADFLASKYFTRFEFQPSGKSVASYSVTDGTIIVSNHFFEGEIVEQISTLIHEAQHSEVSAPWHESCYKGQLIGASGACDGVLETKINLAGSYTVEYWFLKLVEHTNNKYFSRESRATAARRTNELAAHRFNHAFDNIHNNDVFVVLTEDNLLKAYDPITKTFKSINKPFRDKINKIQKNYRNEGFYAITDDGNLYNWGATELKFKDLTSYNIDSFQGKIKNFYRVVHPEYGINRNLLITADNKQYIESINEKLNREYQLVEGRAFQSSYILRSHDEVVLRNNSTVEIVNPMFGKLDLKNDTMPKEINYIFPSHFGYSFYSISGDGELYFGRILSQLFPGNMGSVPTDLSFTKDELQVPSGAKAIKYEEGLEYRAILDNNGELRISKHKKDLKFSVAQQPAISKLLNHNLKVKDFTIIRRTKQTHEEEIESQKIINFKRRCDVEKVRLDPWLNRPIGIDGNGHLIIDDPEACQVLADKVISFDFKPRAMKFNPFGYLISELWLTLVSGEKIHFNQN